MTSNANPGVLQNPIIFTATLSAAVGAPTGTVTFLDGTTPIGTGTLAGGIATLTLSSLGVGNHTITAAYPGDANFIGVTSGPLTQSILDFTLTNQGAGTSQTVLPGGAATYTLAITPSSGTTLPMPATLSLSGLPSGVTVTVAPAAWVTQSATSWTLPANTTLSNVTFTVTVPAQTARLERNDSIMKKAPTLLLGLLLLPFTKRMRRSAKRLSKVLSLALLIAVALGTIAGLTGCGAIKSTAQPQTYTVNETVSVGTLSHTTSVTLTVQ